MKIRCTALTYISLLGLLAGCGDDDEGGTNHVENPQPAEGGGVAGGSIRGELNVFVLDDDDAPIAGASVRVGGATDAEPLVGTTGANGLVTFSDDGLAGKQTITASASGRTPSTIIGANGAV